jgi:catechol 2,3-dioxygenase-like lactoylglutathione lyase family enzyme
VDYKLELMCVPVSDVDKAKEFYVDKVGFVADHDQRVNDGLRFVQLTPPGSGCSICIGQGLTTMTPGSLEGLQLVVDDAQVAHDDLAGRGVEVSDVTDLAWGRFVYFKDPDGNAWNIQQLKGVLPGH